MTLRKTAGLLMAFGLTIGLIGTGLSATFTDQVTATENIAVGTFGCEITAGNGNLGNVPHTGSSITYNAPLITSSAAGDAPFTFTVTNTGTIPQQLTITAAKTGLTSSFTAMTLAPASPVVLGASASQAFNTGIEWGALGSTDLGVAGDITWTVDCDEVPPPPEPVTIVRTQTGIAATGWYGWSCPAGSTIVSGSVDTLLVVDGPAKSGVTTDGWTYPDYFHYDYTPPEEGWVVHNAGGPETQVLTIVCQP